MLYLYDKCPTATEYPFSCEECSHTNWAGNGLHLNDDGKHVERLVNMMMIPAFEQIRDLQYQLRMVKTSCSKGKKDVDEEAIPAWLGFEKLEIEGE